MRDKIKKHPRPEIYRISFKCGKWVTKAERYYNVFHSSEALEDLAHSFYKGTIHCNKVTVIDIEEYITYANKWVSRFSHALENLTTIDIDTLDVRKDRIIIKK
tara:strand:- start:1755 stop:2063 length:309 start_codon:yes stop_codon:yes gene_type:complete